MAFVKLDTKKLEENFQFLNNLFKDKQIQWAIVSKVLCGNKLYLNELIKLGITQICDSRITNLKVIKELNENIETVYIKPPATTSLSKLVKYADISMNTDLSTIRKISRIAGKQNKVHKIIIMIEMGELREGVLRNDLMDFYKKVFCLPNIEVVGIGANFSCLYGVLPTQDKLIQLSLYEQLIEAKFNQLIPYVSGGSSVVLHLLLNNTLPAAINHFRIGESLFLGTDVYNNSEIKDMHQNIFTLHTEIIELYNKPTVPVGNRGTNVSGETFNFKEKDYGKLSNRAIVDLGLLDVDEKHIWAMDKDIKFVGASSDMIVIDLGKNLNNYKVGDVLEFSMDYMGLLRILNSKYVEKRLN